MKAYVASFEGCDWVALIHGETRGKAKRMFWECAPEQEGDYIDIRMRRIPGLDDKPITYENAKQSGFEYRDDSVGEVLEEYEFDNYCHCSVCNPNKFR